LSLLNRQLRPEQSGSVLSAAALATLARIHRHPGLTPSQLAQAAGVRLQSLTRLLADLEGGAHIRRDAHASDKRQSMLSLTTKGRQSLKAEARRREAALAKAIATCLSADERIFLLEACGLLDHIGNVLARGTGEPSGPAAQGGSPKRLG
jgi:DNA-binding MarR family transcriptional regulator